MLSGGLPVGLALLCAAAGVAALVLGFRDPSRRAPLDPEGDGARPAETPRIEAPRDDP